jgi:hypothetical protein
MRGVVGGSVWACLWVAGCGGSSSPAVGTGADAATDGTSPVEASVEASPGDDDATADVGPGEDTGTVEAGGDGGCTGTGTTCRQCCRTNNAMGYQELVTAELQCACKPSVCGPIDGGAVDAGGGDASVLGTGACASTCGAKALPDATCGTCLDDATGTKAAPGECYTDVSTACQKDADCPGYVACLDGCK